MKKYRDTIYIAIFAEYIFTLIYLIRHTTMFGVALIILTSILIAIAAYLNDIGDRGEEDEDK